MILVAYVNQKKPIIVEGELRLDGLKKYLEGLNLLKCVWLSEDATGIVEKVEFDPKTNQMVGLVLPTDFQTGMPMPFSYLARNTEEIHGNMKCNKSAHVYVIMAQPLVKHVPPYVLQLFGTDNKFSSENILLRWKHTVDELERYIFLQNGFSLTQFYNSQTIFIDTELKSLVFRRMVIHGF